MMIAKRTAILFAIALCIWTQAARVHRLDEYLQAATIDLGKDHITLQLRLTPGVEVFRTVLAEIDTDGNGVISDTEQHAYVERVRENLKCAVDGTDLPLRLMSETFPEVEDLKAGLGEIDLKFEADAPRGAATDHWLVFENHFHDGGAPVYLVNCLVPRDPSLRVTSQDRTFDQSVYRLGYASTGTSASWLARSGGQSLFKAYFYHGVRHILTGYDHLLFVSALVLAATTLVELIKVVTAFTIAHTITLTLAALGVVHLSPRIVEPLISASIVFVALQNVAWPRSAKGWGRLGAAFFFGLFHGLGFAGGLLDAMRQMPSGALTIAIIAFSVGVETGHQLVVLPLFALLTGMRRSKPDPVARTRLTMAVQRIGSTGIALAGGYYLCLAIMGRA